MKRINIVFLVCICVLGGCTGKPAKRNIPDEITVNREQLLDKIKGGWAGQMIGVCFGAPTEFRYLGTVIPDSVELEWNSGLVKNYFNNDDIYMDLTFVRVFERLGLDAPVDSFATAFAYAGYGLHHANQVARYNIQHGIMPPASGHWLNNPHADDIDYQIESDFAGLMSPGMPNAASEVSDGIGHIMNCGDGWYGGVYVGAMYALAAVSDDIPFIVTEALKTIPGQSRFYQCIHSVIDSWRKNPEDWKKAWTECEENWNFNECPESVFHPFNIEAVVNAAYIVIGLLYGEGDFGKTLEIATRCGQDSDCNPSSAGGILGTMLGYDKIPDYWLEILHEVEDLKLDFCDLSLNETYQLSLKHALQMIARNGGKTDGDRITIRCQPPVPVRYEKSFGGMYPIKRESIGKELAELGEVVFEGIGIVVKGELTCADNEYSALVEVSLDGKVADTVELPAGNHDRRLDIYWNYQLSTGAHRIGIKWLNPRNDAKMQVSDMIFYGMEEKK
jgi:hypothetical protein